MARIKKADHIEALRQTAVDAVAYVGMANYSDRERAAERAIHKSADTGKYVSAESCNTGS